MKKFIGFALVSALGAALIAGCAGHSALDGARAAYEKTADAVAIEQTVEVKRGSLPRYIEARTFTLGEEGYAVEETVSVLNSLDAEEPYNTVSRNYTAEKAETFAGDLVITSENLELTASEPDVAARVIAGREEEFLSVESLPAAVTEMSVLFTAGETGLTKLVITFSSGTDDVTVTVIYSY